MCTARPYISAIRRRSVSIFRKRYQNVGDGEVGDGEIPVFWACGLTPQLAVKNAKPPFCITHAPSSMLITDLRNASLAVF